MSESDNSISFKALREYCRELGLTAAAIGMTIDEAIAQARKTDDPRAWLAVMSDAPPEEEGDRDQVSGVSEDSSLTPVLEHDPLVQQLSPSEALAIVKVSLPVSTEMPVGYIFDRTHIEIALKRDAAMAFIKLRTALNKSNARLANGRHVGESNAKTVEWLMERIAAALAGPEPDLP